MLISAALLAQTVTGRGEAVMIHSLPLLAYPICPNRVCNRVLLLTLCVGSRTIGRTFSPSYWAT